MSSCKLRPHHALCVLFFRGRGYSAEFVEGMAGFIAALREADPLLTLRGAADDICRRCPHDDGGVCGSGGKAARYDAAVLRLLGIEDGAVLRWSRLCALVRESILSPNRLGEVCGDCQWYGVCQEALDAALQPPC